MDHSWLLHIANFLHAWLDKFWDGSIGTALILLGTGVVSWWLKRLYDEVQLLYGSFLYLAGKIDAGLDTVIGFLEKELARFYVKNEEARRRYEKLRMHERMNPRHPIVREWRRSRRHHHEIRRKHLHIGWMSGFKMILALARFFSNDLRRKSALELGSMCVGTVLYFVLLGPWRTTKVDMAFGVAGLIFVLWNAQETRERFWGKLNTPYSVRLKKCLLVTSVISILVLALFALIAAESVWFTSGKLEDVRMRILSPHLLIVLPFYIVWAYVQQFLFQFYLMSRLRVLMPSAGPILLAVVNGIFFASIHLDDWQVALPTIASGMVWSFLYLKYRCMSPLAFSHAILGGTYFHWVLNRNIFVSLFSVS